MGKRGPRGAKWTAALTAAVAGLAIVAAVAARALAPAASAAPATLAVHPVGGSGVTGQVRVWADGDRTAFAVRLAGGTGGHPLHVHAGACADPGPQVRYPLLDLELAPVGADGASATVADVPLAALRDAGPLRLVVHAAPDRLEELACADLRP